MQKTSTVKSVQSAGNPWKTKRGDEMHPFEIEMENGDVGVANTKSPDSTKAWPVGEEVSYHLEESERGNKLTKIYENNGSSKGGGKGSNKSYALSYSKDLAVAAIGSGLDNSPTVEKIIENAKKFETYLND